MGVELEYLLEELGASRDDKLVCLELSILTDQGDIKEVSILPTVTQPITDGALEGIVTKSVFFITHSERASTFLVGFSFSELICFFSYKLYNVAFPALKMNNQHDNSSKVSKTKCKGITANCMAKNYGLALG